MPGGPVQTTPNSTPALGGDWFYVAQNSDVEQRVIEELLTIDQSTQIGKNYLLLSQTLPPSARIRWAEIQNVSDVAVTGNDATNTANGIGLFVLTASVPITGSTQYTGSSLFVGYITSTASNSRQRNIPLNYTQGSNVSTSPSYIFLAPCVPTNVSTNATFFVVGAGTVNTASTAGYKFGTATSTNTTTNQIRLRLFVDVYRNMPS